ncbi:hypothetical protein ACJX0J_039415 [Zea mays]
MRFSLFLNVICGVDNSLQCLHLIAFIADIIRREKQKSLSFCFQISHIARMMSDYHGRDTDLFLNEQLEVEETYSLFLDNKTNSLSLKHQFIVELQNVSTVDGYYKVCLMIITILQGLVDGPWDNIFLFNSDFHMEVAKIVMHKLVLHFACFLYYNCLSQYLKVFFSCFMGPKSRLFQQQGIATSIGKDNEEEALLFCYFSTIISENRWSLHQLLLD